MAEKVTKEEKKTKPAEKKTVKKPAKASKAAVKKTTPAKAPVKKSTEKKTAKAPSTSVKAPGEKPVPVKEPKKVAKKKPAKSVSPPGKIKPVLSDETRDLLEKREERAKNQPKFRRNEWFRYKRLGENWKRPRGVSNKTRLKKKYRAPKVRVGFGKPADVRGFHPSGFQEVLVHKPADVDGIDPKIQAIRIGSTVGTRKRRDIVEEADKRKIRILNRGGL